MIFIWSLAMRQLQSVWRCFLLVLQWWCSVQWRRPYWVFNFGEWCCNLGVTIRVRIGSALEYMCSVLAWLLAWPTDGRLEAVARVRLGVRLTWRALRRAARGEYVKMYRSGPLTRRARGSFHSQGPKKRCRYLAYSRRFKSSGDLKRYWKRLVAMYAL